GAGVCSSVGNNSIQNHPGRSTCQSEFEIEDRQGLAWVRSVVSKAGTPHTTRFVFMANAGDKRIAPRLLGRMKHCNRTRTHRDYRPISKTDPLISVLVKQFVAYRPIISLILPPFGMDLAGNFGGQSIGKAFHGLPQKRVLARIHSTVAPIIGRVS